MPEVPHTLDAVRVGLHLANYLVDTGEVLNGHRGPLGGGGVTALWGTDVPGVGVEEGGWDCNLRHRGAHPGGGGSLHHGGAALYFTMPYGRGLLFLTLTTSTSQQPVPSSPHELDSASVGASVSLLQSDITR
jgi:hypothetical protein